MRSPDVVSNDVGGAVVVSNADHVTRCPSRTNVMVRRLKSQRIGPKDYNHFIPSTISNEPRARP
jgi:hypothetical protein